MANKQFSISPDQARSVISSRIKEVVLLHHNDTDGLSSAAILVRALDRENIRVRRVCLEKPYPEVVSWLIAESANPNTVVMVVDFGSGMIPLLNTLASRHNQSIAVLDHHALGGTASSGVTVFSPLLAGLSGEDCSASEVAYLFAVALNNWNRDLAHLGLLGALGDGLIRLAESSPIHKQVITDAIPSGNCSKEFVFKDAQGEYSSSDLVESADALGSLGYLQGGPDIGVKGLADADLYGMVQLAKPYREEFQKVFKECAATIKISESENISWFNLGDLFQRYGVKTVGLFCQYLRDNHLVSDSKYILGFQPIPSILPGLPIMAPKQIKVSMRVPPNLAGRIKRGEMPDLAKILPVATEALGGFVDACHPLAASTTVPPGSEADLLELLESIM